MKKSMLLFHALAAGAVLFLFLGSAPLQAKEKITEVKEYQESAGDGWLGVMLSQSVKVEKENGEERKMDRGVEIIGVMDDSAAEKAGLEKGDVIVMIDGKEVTDVSDAVKMIGSMHAGDNVMLVILRDGAEKKIAVVLGERPEKEKFIFKGLEGTELKDLEELKKLKDLDFIWQSGGKPRLGVELIELTGQLREYFKVDEGQGVLVSKVIEETPAQRAGLKAGDVILSINNKEVGSVSEIREALSEVEKGQIAEVEVMRDGGVLLLNAEIDTEKSKGENPMKLDIPGCEKSKNKKIIVLEDEKEEDL